jgi:hypothetical protein
MVPDGFYVVQPIVIWDITHYFIVDFRKAYVRLLGCHFLLSHHKNVFDLVKFFTKTAKSFYISKAVGIAQIETAAHLRAAEAHI